MTTPDELLLARLVSSPETPLVTYYNDDTGERIEVSAATFANWVAKTANLLVDECGLGPGSRVSLTLPAHWQSLAVVHAIWALGACVSTSTTDSVDVLVRRSTDTDAHDHRADDVLVMALAPLAAPGPALAGAVIDYDREVRAHGDHFQRPRFDSASAAWTRAEGTLDFDAVGARAASAWGAIATSSTRPTPTRFMVTPSALDVDTVVACTLVPLLAPSGGSVLTKGTGNAEARVRRLSAERAVDWIELDLPSQDAP